MKYHLLAAGAVALGLAGCAGGQVAPPINTLGSAEQSLTVADQAILAYETLPPCGPGATAICQSPEVKGALKTASFNAYNAIETARPVILANPAGGTAVDAAMTDVNAAIAALDKVVATLPH